MSGYASTVSAATMVNSSTIYTGEQIVLQGVAGAMTNIMTDGNTVLIPSSSTGAFTMNSEGSFATCMDDCAITVGTKNEEIKSSTVTVMGGVNGTVTVLNELKLEEPNDSFNQNVITPFSTVKKVCLDIGGKMVQGKVNGIDASSLSPLTITTTIIGQEVRVFEPQYSEKAFNFINDSLKQSLEQDKDIAICLDDKNEVRAIGVWKVIK